jgi:hypothetical protein
LHLRVHAFAEHFLHFVADERSAFDQCFGKSFNPRPVHQVVDEVSCSYLEVSEHSTALVVVVTMQAVEQINDSHIITAFAAEVKTSHASGAVASLGFRPGAENDNLVMITAKLFSGWVIPF